MTEITDVELFASLDSTEAGLKQSCHEVFGRDESAGGFIHKRDFAKILEVWARSHTR